MNRTGKDWKVFVERQKAIIINRLKKYKNVQTAKDSLVSTGDLSHYQKYKSSVVSKYLERALTKIEEGTYGTCEVCHKEIDLNRLKLVPAALTCVECDDKKAAIYL